MTGGENNHFHTGLCCLPVCVLFYYSFHSTCFDERLFQGTYKAVTFYSYRCDKLEEGHNGAFKTCIQCGLGAANVGVCVEEMWLM